LDGVELERGLNDVIMVLLMQSSLWAYSVHV